MACSSKAVTKIVSGMAGIPTVSITARPSSSGIFTSRKSRSGWQERIRSTVICPSVASQTELMPGSWRNRSSKRRRAGISSSATKTPMARSGMSRLRLPGSSFPGVNRKQQFHLRSASRASPYIEDTILPRIKNRKPLRGNRETKSQRLAETPIGRQPDAVIFDRNPNVLLVGASGRHSDQSALGPLR